MIESTYGLTDMDEKLLTAKMVTMPTKGQSIWCDIRLSNGKFITVDVGHYDGEDDTDVWNKKEEVVEKPGLFLVKMVGEYLTEDIINKGLALIDAQLTEEITWFKGDN